MLTTMVEEDGVESCWPPTGVRKGRTTARLRTGKLSEMTLSRVISASTDFCGGRLDEWSGG